MTQKERIEKLEKITKHLIHVYMESEIERGLLIVGSNPEITTEELAKRKVEHIKAFEDFLGV